MIDSVIKKLLLLYYKYRLSKYRMNMKISESAKLAAGFKVDFYVPPEDRIYVRIGEKCLLHSRIIFESTKGNVVIGDNAYIGAKTTIICRESIKIGNNVTMAWGIVIYDHNSQSFDWETRARMVQHFYDTYETGNCFTNIDWTDVESKEIVINDKVWIGFDAVILKGVTIGEGAVIGARSVVTKDVPPYCVVAGNPARVVRTLTKEDDRRHRA